MEEQNLPESTPPLLPTSTMAIISLVAGLAGIFFLPLIGGVAAIITGNMARKETNTYPPTASGSGLATAGMTLGWISIILWVVICCVIASGLIIGIFVNSR